VSIQSYDQGARIMELTDRIAELESRIEGILEPHTNEQKRIRELEEGKRVYEELYDAAQARIRELEELLREWRDVQCDQAMPLPFMRRVDAALGARSDRGDGHE